MYEKFEKLLKDRGLTTAEVAQATGIRQSVFSNWKKRRGHLNFENMMKVAAFFEIPVTDLLP